MIYDLKIKYLNIIKFYSSLHNFSKIFVFFYFRKTLTKFINL